MTGETHAHLIGQLASVLTRLRSIRALPDRLCEAGRQMMSADGAAITLATSGGVRVRVGATDPLAAQLEDLQDVVGQGPSIEALESGAIQVASFGDEDDSRWSLMHAHGAHLGFSGIIIAVPLVVDDRVIGSLSAHRQSPEASDSREVGRFLGVALAAALVQDSDLGLDGDADPTEWASQARIHQATGMVVAQTGVLPEDALALLKGHAFAENATLVDVAQHIIERRINFRQFTIEGD